MFTYLVISEFLDGNKARWRQEDGEGVDYLCQHLHTIFTILHNFLPLETSREHCPSFQNVSRVLGAKIQASLFCGEKNDS